MVGGIGSFGEIDIVSASRGCSDCDSCKTFVCPEEFLGRGVKTRENIDDSSNQIKETFLDRGDSL